MCLSCWENEGRPYKVTEAVLRWAPRFGEAVVGGPLHIVVEDWNLADSHLKSCRNENPSSEELALLDALAKMSWEERWATAIWASGEERWATAILAGSVQPVTPQ